jgi:hypothetical protein
LAADDAAKDRDHAARRILELESVVAEQRTTFEESATKYEGLIAKQNEDPPNAPDGADDSGKKAKKKKKSRW